MTASGDSKKRTATNSVASVAKRTAKRVSPVPIALFIDPRLITGAIGLEDPVENEDEPSAAIEEAYFDEIVSLAPRAAGHDDHSCTFCGLDANVLYTGRDDMYTGYRSCIPCCPCFGCGGTGRLLFWNKAWLCTKCRQSQPPSAPTADLRALNTCEGDTHFLAQGELSLPLSIFEN
jgi:hypothetical protein